MSNFLNFTFQTNFIVMKLLHYGTFRPQADFSHQFAVVIEIGVIISLIYCNQKTVSELDIECCTHYF